MSITIISKIDMKDIGRKINKKSRKALIKAGEELIKDSENEDPKTPVKTGRLINSRFLQIDENGNVVVGYSAPYASFVHSDVSYGKKRTKYKDSSSNGAPLFLQSKVKKNIDKYLQIVSDAINERGR